MCDLPWGRVANTRCLRMVPLRVAIEFGKRYRDIVACMHDPSLNHLGRKKRDTIALIDTQEADGLVGGRFDTVPRRPVFQSFKESHMTQLSPGNGMHKRESSRW
jgi:hypothetical protein